MRRFLIRAVLAGLPFGILMAVFNSLIFGEGILLGLATGAFFGIWMAAATSASQRRGKRNPPRSMGKTFSSGLWPTTSEDLKALVGGWCSRIRGSSSNLIALTSKKTNGPSLFRT